MNAARVHAVVAAAVENPHLLESWQQAPVSLRRLGVEPAALDFAAIRRFAGLALKVRHNGLRDLYPYTFRLLGVQQLGITLFAAYADHCATKGVCLAANPEQRARDLIAFIADWLDRDQPAHVMLWDVLRHEHALAQLRSAGMPARKNLPHRRPTLSSRACLGGPVVLHEMQFDPRVLVHALQQSMPSLNELVPASHNMCYWRSADDGTVQIAALDPFAFAVVSLADGEHCIADLLDALHVTGRDTNKALKLLCELEVVGLIGFIGNRRAATP